jgi:tetratricopeptide (TPR) repeat protein
MQERLDQLWDWDDAAESEARFREAAEDAGDERSRDMLLTQVARALGLQGQFAEAAEVLDSLPSGADAELDVRIALERGRVLSSSDHADGAWPLFEEALALAQEAGLENLAVDAVHMLAIVAPPEERTALNERAIAMAGAAADPRARQWLASLYNNLGWTRLDAEQADEALRLFELALAERQKRDQPRETAIARWAVARALRATGRVEEALAAQVQLAADNVNDGVDDPYVDEEIGECLLVLEREIEARPHFARAAEGLAADPWMAEHEAVRIARLQQLASQGGDGT